MRKLLCIILALIVAVCLSACGWIENEYTVISSHVAPPPTEPEIIDVVTPFASDINTLRDLILSFIRDGSARNEIDVTGYEGDLSYELPQLLRRLETNSLYAYAVDYVDYDVVERDGAVYLELNLVLRRSADEIAGIVSVRGMAAVEEQLVAALESLSPGLTVRVAGYKNMDFDRLIYRYCLTHPDTIVEFPEVSLAVFPNSGGSRVLEFHFSYGSSKADIHNMRKNMDTMLASVYKFTAGAEDKLSQYSLLCEFLIGRTRHESSSLNACAYNLICKQEANNRGFASVVAYIAEQNEAECYLVEGTKNGLPYCWNIIEVDGEYRHIDLMQQWLDNNSELRLLTDSAMDGYTWNTNVYPECFDPDEPEPEVETEPADVSEPDDDEDRTDSSSEADTSEPEEPSEEPATEAETENETE